VVRTYVVKTNYDDTLPLYYVIINVHSAYNINIIIYNIAVVQSPRARKNKKKTPRKQQHNTIV